MKKLFGFVSFVLLVVASIYCMAGEIVPPSNAGLIESVVEFLAARWPGPVDTLLNWVGVFAVLSMAFPEKIGIGKYGDKRWYHWFFWFIHRFGGNQFQARNAQ